MKRGHVALVAIILIAIVLIGEVIAYSGSSINSYSADAERNGDEITYSVSSSGTNDYGAVLLENNGFQRVTELVIYVDENFYNYYKEACSQRWVYDTGATYYAEQLQKSLKIRSYDNVRICDSNGLTEYINSTSSDPKGHGILSVSYSLPGAVYSGHSSDKLLKWIEDGGSLYWMGSIPGEFYYNDGKLIRVGNCQELFFGSVDCICTGVEEITKYCEDDLTSSLTLKNNYAYFGVNTNKISSEYLSVGFNDDGKSSDTFVKKGNGMIVQYGGGFEIVQMEDIAQTIAAGVCYKTSVIDSDGGRVTRTTEHGTFESSLGDIVYIYIGRSYPVYGRAVNV